MGNSQYWQCSYASLEAPYPLEEFDRSQEHQTLGTVVGRLQLSTDDSNDQVPLGQHDPDVA